MDDYSDISNWKPDGLSEIFLREKNRLFSFIKNRVSDLEEAEDILQDVFFQLADGYEAMPPIENLSAWLFTVARNKITDSYRKMRPERMPDPKKQSGGERKEKRSNSSNEPDALFERSMITATLEEALEELPENQRDVFIMHQLEKKSFKEIAELTGLPVNTLISRKRYAVLHLRTRLQEIYKEL